MALRGGIDGDRARAGLLTAATVAALGYALVAGLAVPLPTRPADVMKLFALAAPRPPEPREKPPPPHPRQARREGASAPPNLRSKAAPVVAPVPIVPLRQPPPLVTAPIPAIGNDASSGAALVAGPGTGAGGQGNGTGSGRSGNGEGDGGTPLRQIGDDLRARDIPGPIVRELLRTGVVHYVVDLRFTVGVAGRVTDCAVTRSSGNARLDATTCRLAIEKLRYRPELDGAGRPIPVTVAGVQEWTIGRPPPGEQPDEEE